MPEVLVRLAHGSELEEVRAVLADAYSQYEGAFPASNWVPYLADILDLEGRSSASELLVAELEGEIVACVSYYPPGAQISYPSPTFSEHWPAEWAAFRLLAVSSSARGHGVGRLLTHACIERAQAAGAPAVGLHTTTPMAVARALYQRMGFERAPRYDFQPAPELLVEAYQLPL